MRNQGQLKISLSEGLVTQSAQGALNVHLSTLLLMPMPSWSFLVVSASLVAGQDWVTDLTNVPIPAEAWSACWHSHHPLLLQQ